MRSNDLTCSRQDMFQACRTWTISVFQHITENDFTIRILEQSMYYIAAYLFGDDDDDTDDGGETWYGIAGRWARPRGRLGNVPLWRERPLVT